MKLDTQCPVRLGRLLANVWDLHRKRELAHHSEVAKRAAQKAVEDPGEFPVVVPGFGYLVIFDENGEIRGDPLADPEIYPGSIPTPETIQQACAIRKKRLAELNGITEGWLPPQIHWNGEEIEIEPFLARNRPVAAKWSESFEFGPLWVEQGGMTEPIWEYVAK
jgi:hypothetical protein